MRRRMTMLVVAVLLVLAPALGLDAEVPPDTQITWIDLLWKEVAEVFKVGNQVELTDSSLQPVDEPPEGSTQQNTEGTPEGDGGPMIDPDG